MDMRLKVGAFVVFGSVAIIMVAGMMWETTILRHWLVTMVLMAVTLCGIGWTAVGRWWAVLIDDRNKFSLSRLQLVLWTVLVLSAFFATALARLAAGVPDPLGIAVPETLWWLMGISTTSLVGTPLVRSVKTNRQPLPSERAATLHQVSSGGPARGQPQPETRGLIVQNVSVEAARWTDLFMGEETGNAAQPDMGKIQMFFFTVVLVVAYGLALARNFQSGTLPSQLPELHGSMLALLGISHAGYLVNKAVPHSTEAS